MARDALLEIGVEEIPARFMLPALEQLQELLERQLQERRLDYEGIKICGTPRRLAALVSGVAEAQEDTQEEVKGPPAERALDEEGKPTQAAVGFARSKGVEPENLVVRETDKGAYLFAVFTQRGRAAVEVLGEVFPQVISQLRFAKAMRWGSGSMRFARPIRWLVGLYGDEVVPFEVAGVESARSSRGHRVLAPDQSGGHGGRPVELASAGDYLERLREAHVIADHRERRQRVAEEAQRAAEEAGGRARLDDELLDELTFLVEWPTGVAGAFDPEYLELPEDVLVTVLRRNQKYFPVTDEQGKLLAKFVTCHNGDPQASDLIRQGHERVIRPRLADAQFFFEQDRKAKLTDWQNELKRVTFLEGAGTVFQKCERLQKLAHWLCEQLDLPMEIGAAAIRAAELCKADLVSKMVMEPDFSSLQGVMGGIYAELRGEPPDVAMAIREHYLPTSAGGPLPQTPAGRIVSIADKMDTIA
ncbi:MAG: glycine--tRNA ligase subunit beta, partial [Armatimonadota bacterium]